LSRFQSRCFCRKCTTSHGVGGRGGGLLVGNGRSRRSRRGEEEEDVVVEARFLLLELSSAKLLQIVQTVLHLSLCKLLVQKSKVQGKPVSVAVG
jgi:hypothetical protein